ncbi:MAG: hypothetical protein R3B70_46620 [Polyangiaceae bacterium]
MNARTLLLFAAAALSLSLAACTSLSRPEEILIQAEPVRAVAQAPAAAAPQPAAPAPAAPPSEGG